MIAALLHRYRAHQRQQRVTDAQDRLPRLMADYRAKQARKRADAARKGWERRRAGA